MKLYAAARVIFCGGFLFVVMSLAVVVAAGIAVNDGVVEKHCQHLLHRKFWRASVDTNAQLVQQIDSALAQSTTKHIGAALLGQEPRHGAMFMFGRLQHLLVNNFSVFYINDSDLWRFSEVLPQFALVGGYSYSLIHDRMVLEISAKIVLLQQIQLQLLLQKLRRISYTAGALTEDHTCTYPFEHLALGGTIALLKLGHDLAHGFSSSYPILFSQS